MQVKQDALISAADPMRLGIAFALIPRNSNR
jgi:hypothetical protein